ncbi:Rieske (2Fe-2S) protein [Pseudomonas rustica]|jgi:nitrite reductase/ring-hydroxylating ferredoxin subunit|uniref:Rieske (2Fe-2S) protein n=1 Tax=Pseudomonas rustica TaxID=2827099 RepID=UPI001BB09D65|nr:Rieske 2Fe-2S domain-containing protein [Pseudomonas rustica]MBS4089808.1 Rieske 2Fe-2S domain-containing protein [Pseudomonas rustica]
MQQAARLCHVDSVLEGQARGFDPLAAGGDSVLVLRSGGQLRVYRNRCPHLQVPMEYRKDGFLSADGQRIICYAHGAQFLPQSGLCVYGPCLGESLQIVPHCIEQGWLLIALDQLG